MQGHFCLEGDYQDCSKIASSFWSFCLASEQAQILGNMLNLHSKLLPTTFQMTTTEPGFKMKQKICMLDPLSFAAS